MVDRPATPPPAATLARGLETLHAFYRVGQEVAVELNGTAAALRAHRATGERYDGVVEGRAGRLEALPGGTYRVEALDAAGAVLAEELTTVGDHQGERPVHGFATSFEDGDVGDVVAWHRALRSTVVQVYDWMASYTEPLGPRDGWSDPSNRPVSFHALRSLASGLGGLGAVAHAYAPVYATGLRFADEHPELLLYEAPGRPVRFLDQIVLANPADPRWQQHFAGAYGSAADAAGFAGMHVDTYGYPRVAEDAEGHPVDMRAAYRFFLSFLRSARPQDLISFNQVNGVPAAAWLPPGKGFRYCEVWPPNDAWRHLEGLLDRSSGRAGMPAGRSSGDAVRGSIACYPPVWGDEPGAAPDGATWREDALRTVVCTEAIATMLGSSALLYGDRTAVLCDAYYPKHARLTSAEAVSALAWHRFALGCRDLFLDGEDTSWYEIGDENGAVSVTASSPVRPEPCAGSLFVRVAHGTDDVTVAVLDLTGSASGRFSERTAKGGVAGATVRVLMSRPETGVAAAAVLGAAGDRFAPLPGRVVAHRQGRALEVRLPLVLGWSVVRIAPAG